MEEVLQKITDDMEAFNIRAENGFDAYTGIFDNFIAEYGQNLKELQELAHQQVEILNATTLMGQNNASLNPTLSSVSVNTKGTNYLQDALNAAAQGDLAGAIQFLKMRGEKVYQTGIDYGTDAKEAYEWVMNTYNSRGTAGYGGSGFGYAEGIENGPVTDTGMTMLHGSESSPEYVLNNDQAYQLLNNLATNDLTRESAKADSKGTETVSTVDEGDATTGVTGNARTELEGINKMISQLSAIINAESLTNSQLIQLNSVISGLIETGNLLTKITQDDIDKDEARYNKLVELLNGYMDTLQGYLDGYNGYFDQGLGKLDDIIAQIQEGISALQGYVSNIIASSGGAGDLGSVGVSGVGSSVGGGGSSGSSSKSDYWDDFDTTTHWLGEAIKAAESGNVALTNKYLDYRDKKVGITKEDYGTDSDEAREEAYSHINTKGWAEGIENGPVTDTGMAMLHGSETEPEYVLNTDQAGQVLENLATSETSVGEAMGEAGVGSETTSTMDEATSTTGVTGNARTTLEGINKIITQASALINQEALTTSQLIQVVAILRELKEAQGLLYELTNADFTADQEHFDTLMAWMNEQISSLLTYLDGLNGKLDLTNENLTGILERVQSGVEAIGNLANSMSGLASQLSSLQSVGMSSVGTTTGTDTGSGNYYYYSKDYLGDALNWASTGDWDSAMNALWNRGEKVDLTKEDYGTNADQAYNKVLEAYKNGGYAEGIENGPVTDTGLTVLHGSNSNPEYVLNSDQAGNLLENMATTPPNTDGTSNLEEGLVDDTLATEGVVEGADNALTEEEQRGRNDGDTSGNRNNQSGESPGTSLGEVGDSGTGNSKTVLSGINKIITQISAMINQQSLTNSNLIQAVAILRGLTEVSNLITSYQNQHIELDTANFGTFMNTLNGINESWTTLFNSMVQNQTVSNELLTQLLSSTMQGVEQLNQIASTISGGLSGSYGYGMWQGGFGGGYGGSFGGGSSGGSFGGGGSGGSSSGGGSYGNKDFLEDIFSDPDATRDDGDMDISGWYSEDIDYSQAYQDAKDQGASQDILDQIEDLRDQKVEDKYGGKDPNPNWKESSTTGAYANGIENGPVTYTGLAMLHGTPTSPEFVLNSDQAYNLLRYMATAKATEFERENVDNSGTSYVLYGDVNLKTDTSPEKFWNAVAQTMGSRWNTTKNIKR